MDRSLSKKERLSSHAAIEKLIGGGRYISRGPLRCCFLNRAGDTEETGEVPNIRIMVTVPKKFFKRAVKRNLLKRRIREAYRLQKSFFPDIKADMMFVYSSKDIIPYTQLHSCVGEILQAINEKR